MYEKTARQLSLIKIKSSLDEQCVTGGKGEFRSDRNS